MSWWWCWDDPFEIKITEKLFDIIFVPSDGKIHTQSSTQPKVDNRWDDECHQDELEKDELDNCRSHVRLRDNRRLQAEEPEPGSAV